jgi:hypothetical protein
MGEAKVRSRSTATNRQSATPSVQARGGMESII